MEIVHFDKVMQMIKSFSPLERVLLSTAGTLQTALSAYFWTPVKVRVVSQTEIDDTHISRDISLYSPTKEIEVCRATTDIVVDLPDVKRLILEGKYGLGQILEIEGIRAVFEIAYMGQDAKRFWRVYKLTGPGVVYRIREEFNKALYDGCAPPSKA